MPSIKVVTLGAGQDVGRSCVLITIGGRNVMLDCGMHAGHTDARKFPDFTYLNGVSGGNCDTYLTCVIISHFHLDHCGALPHLTEIVGYNGPIYMTYPTKAIAPVLLEDYRRIQFEYKGDKDMYTSAHIKMCMSKVKAVSLHETVRVDDTMTIRAFYAGHVLGAAMFEIRCGNESVIYTGDYNTTPDRHLGAAQIKPGLKPDLLITETTYATTIRDSKRARERDFLKKVHDVVDRGGKVLIPVFALGRAQELCILIESYWERMDLQYPIYFSAGLAEKANQYYRLFINWTNEKIKRTFVHRNMFDFKHIKPFDMGMVDMPGPIVLFATPGMLHGGQSLRVFKAWAPDPRNMIIMPGYCVAGTPGHAVLNGAKKVTIERDIIDVNIAVEYMSFSAHADAKGIMQLIKDCQPKHVMFVHGENIKMEFLKQKVEKEFGLKVYKPANGETIHVPTELDVRLRVPSDIVDQSISMCPSPAKRHCPFNAYVAMSGTDQKLCVVSENTVANQLGQSLHSVKFTSKVLFLKPDSAQMAQQWWSIVDTISDHLGAVEHPLTDTSVQYGNAVNMEYIDGCTVLKWTLNEDKLASDILAKLQTMAK